MTKIGCAEGTAVITPRLMISLVICDFYRFRAAPIL